MVEECNSRSINVVNLGFIQRGGAPRDFPPSHSINGSMCDYCVCVDYNRGEHRLIWRLFSLKTSMISLKYAYITSLGSGLGGVALMAHLVSPPQPKIRYETYYITLEHELLY